MVVLVTLKDTATKPTPEVTASPTVSETPEPEVTEANTPEPPAVVVPSPDVPIDTTLVPSFGAIARSPSLIYIKKRWHFAPPVLN